MRLVMAGRRGLAINFSWRRVAGRKTKSILSPRVCPRAWRKAIARHSSPSWKTRSLCQTKRRGRREPSAGPGDRNGTAAGARKASRHHGPLLEGCRMECASSWGLLCPARHRRPQKGVPTRLKRPEGGGVSRAREQRGSGLAGGFVFVFAAFVNNVPMAF